MSYDNQAFQLKMVAHQLGDEIEICEAMIGAQLPTTHYNEYKIAFIRQTSQSSTIF